VSRAAPRFFRARPRICAKLGFLSVIIADNDYRKGQRPPQFLLIDSTAVKSFFCGASRESERERERERRGGKRDGVAGVFAISIYSDYSGARSSADRDGNKFDKSISSATTTRSNLSARIFAARTRAIINFIAASRVESPDSSG